MDFYFSNNNYDQFLFRVLGDLKDVSRVLGDLKVTLKTDGNVIT